MTSQSNLERFNRIYDETYQAVLKYVVVHCHNIQDVKDILQETYLEFWNILNRREIVDIHIKSFLMGIAKHKIQKHYKHLTKWSMISLFSKNDKETEWIDILSSDIDIEQLVIRNDAWDKIWNYIKDKKDKNIPKIFYLYYKLELTIKEISQELKVSESYVKNCIYRTLKELNSVFGGGDYNDK